MNNPCLDEFWERKLKIKLLAVKSVKDKATPQHTPGCTDECVMSVTAQPSEQSHQPVGHGLASPAEPGVGQESHSILSSQNHECHTESVAPWHQSHCPQTPRCQDELGVLPATPRE